MIPLRHDRHLDIAKMFRTGMNCIARAIVITGVVTVARAVTETIERLNVDTNAMPFLDTRHVRYDFDFDGHDFSAVQRRMPIVAVPM